MNPADEKNPMTLLGRDTVEVYASDAGFVCIKQDDPLRSHDDQTVILLLPTDIPQITKWLQECAEMIQSEAAKR